MQIFFDASAVTIKMGCFIDELATEMNLKNNPHRVLKVKNVSEGAKLLDEAQHKELHLIFVVFVEVHSSRYTDCSEVFVVLEYREQW
jgi:hypothetical protein